MQINWKGKSYKATVPKQGGRPSVSESQRRAYIACIYADSLLDKDLRQRQEQNPTQYPVSDHISRETITRRMHTLDKGPVIMKHSGGEKTPGFKPNRAKFGRSINAEITDQVFDSNTGKWHVMFRPYDNTAGDLMCHRIEGAGWKGISLCHDPMDASGQNIVCNEVSLCEQGARDGTGIEYAIDLGKDAPKMPSVREVYVQKSLVEREKISAGKQSEKPSTNNLPTRASASFFDSNSQDTLSQKMATMTETVQQPAQSYPATSAPMTAPPATNSAPPAAAAPPATNSAPPAAAPPAAAAPLPKEGSVSMDLVQKPGVTPTENKAMTPLSAATSSSSSAPMEVDSMETMSKNVLQLEKVMDNFGKFVNEKPEDKQMMELFKNLQEGMRSVVKTGAGGFRLFSQAKDQLKMATAENEQNKKEKNEYKKEVDASHQEREDTAAHFVSETEAMFQQLLPFLGKKETDELKASLGDVSQTPQTRKAMSFTVRKMANRIIELDTQNKALKSMSSSSVGAPAPAAKPSLSESNLSAIFQEAHKREQPGGGEAASSLSRKAAFQTPAPPPAAAAPAPEAPRKSRFFEDYRASLMKQTGLSAKAMDDFDRVTSNFY